MAPLASGAPFPEPGRRGRATGERRAPTRQCRSVVQVESTLRTFGHEPQVVFRSDNNATVQGLVSGGLGSALVPLLAIDLSDERTVAIGLGERSPPRLIGVAWHRDRYQSAAERAFVEAAADACCQLAAEPAATSNLL